MPFVPPTATTPEYALVVFDALGREVAEADGSALSTAVAARVADDDVADVVLMCHGWLDDLPAAEDTYRGWLTTAHGLSWPGARPPLVVGAHWPSVPAAGGEPPDLPAELLAHLADGRLLDSLNDAGVEIADFLSFWGMRGRAIALGAADSGLGRLLARIFEARPGVRVHLVGHSLGCVALSGALVAAGAAAGPHAASLLMVEAAESSWAFSAHAPFFTGGSGKYAAVVSDGLVDGPLVATRSSHDDALRVLYRLGMEFVLERSYAAASVGQPARSAAIGSEGFRFDPPVATSRVLPALEPGATRFAVEAGHQYSIDCSAVIGAHNDVDHAELAALFFAMVAV